MIRTHDEIRTDRIPPKIETAPQTALSAPVAAETPSAGVPGCIGGAETESEAPQAARDICPGRCRCDDGWDEDDQWPPMSETYPGSGIWE